MENIRRNQTYRKRGKNAVQLTSLLDLLFVMIFVSLIQQKNIPIKPKTKAKGKITKVKIKPTVKPIEKTKPKATPAPVVLKTYPVEATFYFHPSASNPNIPSGTYSMKGFFDEKTRALQLGGIKWIDQPNKDYGMVPLTGRIEQSDSVFVGRVEFTGCKQFTLKRTQKIPNLPISGVWKGEYDCAQGATGLTLTIK